MSYVGRFAATVVVGALLVPATALAADPPPVARHAAIATPVQKPVAKAATEASLPTPLHLPTAGTPGPHPSPVLPSTYPGTFRAALNTVVAPLVGVAENRTGWRYKVTPYITEVEPSNGARGAVVRSSRPSSLAVDVKPELTKKGVLDLSRHTNPAALKEGYAYLYASGIRAVVDLRFEGKQAEARRAAERAGLEYHHVALKDNAWFNPQPLLVAAVNAIEKAASGGKNVDVHCEAGIGRTGLVIAAHQAFRQNMTEDEAVAYARGHGLELFGQEHALRVFVRSIGDGTIHQTPEGTLSLAEKK